MSPQRISTVHHCIGQSCSYKLAQIGIRRFCSPHNLLILTQGDSIAYQTKLGACIYSTEVEDAAVDWTREVRSSSVKDATSRCIVSHFMTPAPYITPGPQALLPVHSPLSARSGLARLWCLVSNAASAFIVYYIAHQGGRDVIVIRPDPNSDLPAVIACVLPAALFLATIEIVSGQTITFVTVSPAITFTYDWTITKAVGAGGTAFTVSIPDCSCCSNRPSSCYYLFRSSAGLG